MKFLTKSSCYKSFLDFSASSAISAWSSLKAMITYPIKTTFAIRAARPPAYVALPGEGQLGFCTIGSRDIPPKTKLTLKKYVPMGSVIMANVKLISFQITELCHT
jgi:hypothetical protein